MSLSESGPIGTDGVHAHEVTLGLSQLLNLLLDRVSLNVIVATQYFDFAGIVSRISLH